jgi:cell growth-regulating nucleolar protein
LFIDLCVSLCYLDDYRVHTSCVSEAERYEKTVYKGNKKNAKKNPQEAWTDLIAEAAKSAPLALKSYMQRLAELDNVPRKEKPFRNWAANSLNLRGQHALVTASLWKYLSEVWGREQAERKKAEEEEKRLRDERSEKQRLEAEGKTEINTNETTSLKAPDVDIELTSKLVRKAMKKVLKKAPKRSMKIKVLRSALEDALGIKKHLQKKLKMMLVSEIQANSDKIVVDGKLVTLK